ncbi:hypothetical protein MEQU1_001200 [Malassezia equina]|uniref:RING-type domain-containing protein n=1 Tax=Malassezia equina TaxID=1381935 RepID=A0AAF0EBJ1_9BASI|nr:hypothetical protein MEQU1_001200 [Malassezia equina]
MMASDVTDTPVPSAPAAENAAPSIPPVTNARVRVLGPDMGALTGAGAQASESLSLATLHQWIEGEAKEARLSVMELFVNVQRSHTTLGLASPSTSHAWMRPTQAALQLPAPTHTLSCRCDCIAPFARVDLYVHAPRQTTTVIRTPTLPENHGALSLPGWHLVTLSFPTAFDHLVTMPLVLDDQWVVTEGVLTLTMTIEALDEDHRPLEKPNALTTKWEATQAPGTPDVWQIRLVAQHARIGPFVLGLHELFGLDAHHNQPLTPPPESKAEDAPPTNPLALNENLVHSAALLTEDLREDGNECPICMSETTSTLLFPCTHALCLECAVRIRDSVQKSRALDRERGRAPRRAYACPLCRRIIESMISLTQ